MKTTSLELLSFLLLSLSASAQWSSDPGANLSIGDGTGDQVQSKLAPSADGGCYISWYDNSIGGYDLRLQRLDAAGNEQWGHNGVLVADRGFSSTQDYGLDIDAAGNALLAFRDDRPGGVQITAALVTPAGVQSWGAGGRVLTSTSAFVAAPKIAGTSDGQVVVAWTQDADMHLQRLDAAGTPLWGADVIMTPSVGTYSASDLHGAGTDAILSIVHRTGTTISAPRHLEAQKLDSAGAFLWGAAPVSVFDSGSLQIGNFPSFVSDGSGGAVFGWYGVSPLQCYAQHLLANGSEAFPHNGVSGSTHPTQLRANPSVSYDAASGSTFLSWQEDNSNQSLTGVGAQRFDPSGARLWGAQGVTIVPLSGTFISWATTVADGAGAFVFWSASPAFGQDVLRGAHVDLGGAVDIAIFDLASTPSNKLRLSGARSTGGDVFLTWTDGRVDGGDIFAQNVRPDGSLGGAPWSAYCFGTGCPCANDDAGAGCANSTASGCLLVGSGSVSVAADDFQASCSGGPVGQPALLFAGTAALPSLPFGAGFRCVGGTTWRLGIRVLNGGAASWGPGLALAQGAAATDVRHFQVWYRDPTGGCIAGWNLSNALALTYLP